MHHKAAHCMQRMHIAAAPLSRSPSLLPPTRISHSAVSMTSAVAVAGATAPLLPEEGSISISVQVKWLGEQRGFGVFTTRDVTAGEVSTKEEREEAAHTRVMTQLGSFRVLLRFCEGAVS